MKFAVGNSCLVKFKMKYLSRMVELCKNKLSDLDEKLKEKIAFLSKVNFLHHNECYDIVANVTQLSVHEAEIGRATTCCVCPDMSTSEYCFVSLQANTHCFASVSNQLKISINSQETCLWYHKQFTWKVIAK